MDQARLNLQYATIRAPISGLTGSLRVREGNLVRSDRRHAPRDDQPDPADSRAVRRSRVEPRPRSSAIGPATLVTGVRAEPAGSGGER